jgi:heptosyltransferase-1
MTEIVARDLDSPLIGTEYRRLLVMLHAASEEFAMDIAVAPRADEQAAALLHTVGLAGRFAVFCPFTTRPQKHWFDERWAALGARLRIDAGVIPVLVGGPGDRERAEGIVAASGSLAMNLCGRTRLDECAALIRRAELVVGVDTGMTHMGLAMNRPTLTLLGSTDPYFETGTALGRVLHHPLPCFPCYRRPTCGGEFTCMRLHTVDGVFAAVQALLAEVQEGGQGGG